MQAAYDHGPGKSADRAAEGTEGLRKRGRWRCGHKAEPQKLQPQLENFCAAKLQSNDMSQLMHRNGR